MKSQLHIRQKSNGQAEQESNIVRNDQKDVIICDRRTTTFMKRGLEFRVLYLESLGDMKL